MSKRPKKSPKSHAGELRTEYHVDYTKSRPNRFAGRMSGGAVAIVLEPDVAQVFNSADSVNQLLRSVISALPERPAKRRKAGNGLDPTARMCMCRAAGQSEALGREQDIEGTCAGH
jgi:hypothetical protein